MDQSRVGLSYSLGLMSIRTAVQRKYDLPSGLRKEKDWEQAWGGTEIRWEETIKKKRKAKENENKRKDSGRKLGGGRRWKGDQRRAEGERQRGWGGGTIDHLKEHPRALLPWQSIIGKKRKGWPQHFTCLQIPLLQMCSWGLDIEKMPRQRRCGMQEDWGGSEVRYILRTLLKLWEFPQFSLPSFIFNSQLPSINYLINST